MPLIIMSLFLGMYWDEVKDTSSDLIAMFINGVILYPFEINGSAKSYAVIKLKKFTHLLSNLPAFLIRESGRCWLISDDPVGSQDKKRQ